MRPLCLLLPLIALASACGDPAVTASLELRIDLPAATGMAAHALVQIRRQDGSPFDTGFEDDDMPLPSVALGATRSEDAISVLTSDSTADLKVRIRFCSALNCVGEGDAPAQRFVLRDPFHDGERTLYRMFVGDPTMDVPSPEMIDGCQIRGCVESDLSTYCDSTGMHFCEGSHPPGPAPGATAMRVVEIE